jgi:hypothetical protein
LAAVDKLAVYIDMYIKLKRSMYNGG